MTKLRLVPFILLTTVLHWSGDNLVTAQTPPPPPPQEERSHDSLSYLYPDKSCPLLTLLPFGSLVPTYESVETNRSLAETGRLLQRATSMTAFSYLAAAQMALLHFNQRNPVLVPELSSPTLRDCPVTMPTQYVLSSAQDTAGVKAFLDPDMMAFFAKESSNATEDPSYYFPCAVLGPDGDKASMLLAPTTEAVGIPQMSYFADTGLMLGREHLSPIGGAVLDQNGRSHRMIEYLQSIGRNHLAGLYTPSPDSSFQIQSLRREAELYGNFKTFFLQADAVSDNFQNVLASIRETGIRTVFLNLARPQEWVLAANALHQLNMTTSHEYLFIVNRMAYAADTFNEILGPPQPGSPLDHLVRGAMVLERVDPWEIQKENERFMTTWRQQDSSLVQELNQMVPLDPSHPGYFQADGEYFQTTMPSRYSSFIYDTVMSIGFGACDALALEEEEKEEEERMNEPPPAQGNGVKGSSPKSSPLDGLPTTTQGGSPPLPKKKKKKGYVSPLHSAILDTSFTGASGKVRYHEKHPPRVREALDVHVGVYNVRPVDDGVTGIRQYDQVLTSVWEPEFKKWRPVEGVSFLYSSDSTVPPVSYQISDENYLYPWARVVGLAMLAVAWLLALGGAFAVWYFREDEAICRCQPTFLIMICCGSAVLTTSIFTLSHDEGNGWNQEALEISCMATPWFFFMGHVIVFCAMFTKLWRLDKVLQFTRRKVTVKDVVAPLLLLCTLTLGLLLTWTIIDPWTWNRDFVSTVPPETYGECQGDMFWAFFGPLMGIILCSETITVFFALKTADAPDDFSDSRPILLAICMHIQAWIVGIPILAVLGNSSSSATYFGRVFLICIFAISSVVTVVWPRILLAVKLRRKPDLTRAKSRVRISGLIEKSPANILIDPSPFGSNSISGLQSVGCSVSGTNLSTQSVLSRQSRSTLSKSVCVTKQELMLDAVNLRQSVLPVVESSVSGHFDRNGKVSSTLRDESLTEAADNNFGVQEQEEQTESPALEMGSEARTLSMTGKTDASPATRDTQVERESETQDVSI